MDYFKIAGLKLQVEFDILQPHKELEDFRSPAFSESDVNITFMAVDHNPLASPNPLLIGTESLGISSDDDSYTYFYKFPKLIYGYKVFKADNRAHIYFNPDVAGSTDTVNITLSKDSDTVPTAQEEFLYSLRDAFFFQALKLGRLPIHSASLSYREHVWLFSAPSGVGKSTHVRLWQEASIECRDFNGDVCMIYRNADGQLMAAALPWCGTSGIYTSRDLPLGGVFYLKRSQENSVVNLQGSDRVIQLLSESLAPNWDRALVSKALDICEDMEKDMLLARLFCNTNPNAALCARDFIDAWMKKCE